MATARVRRRWALACESLEVTKTKEREWWCRVEAGYCEPSRHYHTLVHIDAMLTHISENDYAIRPGAAVRTLMGDIEPLVEMQAKHEMEIQASAFLGTSPIRQYTEGWTMEKLMTTMEKAVSFAVENDVPPAVVRPTPNSSITPQAKQLRDEQNRSLQRQESLDGARGARCCFV